MAAAVRQFSLSSLRCVFFCALSVAATAADESVGTAQNDAEAAARREARATAVALNYCRTSFHRIRRYPTKRVLLEEQQKILNNLNLNGIADEEVVKLYTAVLQEIGQVQIAERERQVIKDRHRRVFYRQLSLTALNLTGELATAHYAAAVRTGAASWWDFRAMGWQTELDTWTVEKAQLVALTDKSALFLDTFWKLARRRNIPDRWLVRSNDLDRLEVAVREPDLTVRLRVLKRMEKFMECYPPYWYYVGRTQQQLGQLFAAAETYRRLAELGSGHFRKDDMLAAGTVNRAAIQQFLKQPGADQTAQQALRFSTDVWEVNLLGGEVLRRQRRFAEAEDAFLRNLDVELEGPQSLAGLLAVYYEWKKKEKLTSLLSRLDVVHGVPVPLLVQTARLLADERLPAPLVQHLRTSLVGRADLRFGRDDLVFHAHANWQVPSARVRLAAAGQLFDQPQQSKLRDVCEVRFRRALELGSPLTPSVDSPVLSLLLDYREGLSIQIHVAHGELEGFDNGPTSSRPDDRYRIVRIDVDESPLWLVPPAQRQSVARSPLPQPEKTPSEKPSQVPTRKPRTDLPVEAPVPNLD